MYPGISFKKALGELLKQSAIKYYKCNFNKDCNITNIDNTNNITVHDTVYDFYNYFHNKTLNEGVDFNLMMITGFIGDLFLKSRGFRISSFVLSLINFGVLFGVYNFEFDFADKEIFDYSILKILSIL